jgi:hypothetical protein
LLMVCEALFGVLFDMMMKRLQLTRYIIFVCNIGRMVCLFLIYFEPSVLLLGLLSTIATIFFIFESVAADYLLCIASQEKDETAKIKITCLTTTASSSWGYSWAITSAACTPPTRES